MVNIVVLGATGHFGARIARRVMAHPGTRLTVTSRNLEAARALAATLAATADDDRITCAALDQDSNDFAARLAALEPDVVIHTAGPYQNQDYRVARACIACHSHYVDLADGREFVDGFSVLDDHATAHDVLLISGASTLPGLSSVVVAEAQDSFARLKSIEISIAPAHRTPRGKGTVAAVLSYCGKPFDALVEDDWRQLHGWQNIRTIRYRDLGLRLAAACDVPDLALFPKRVPNLETVTFHAALEAKWEQLALWAMAAAVRMRMIDDWSRHAARMQWLSDKLVAFGSDRGGMQIRLGGLCRNGLEACVEWSLVAGRNHGPEIPCTPALIIARKLASGDLERRGAVPCWNLFTLEEFDREVDDFDIQWRFDEETRT